MFCTSCKQYFRSNPWNNPSTSTECEDCVDTLGVAMYDSEDELDINKLTNPTGVTQPRFYD
jgi:hypothetical protein